MDRLEWIMLVGMFVLVPFGAYLDFKLVGLNGFWVYVWICLWEYAIFWMGVFIGERVKNRGGLNGSG